MMKRILTLVLCVLCVCAIAGTALADTWYVYTKNGKSLNIRDAQTNEVIGHVPFGTAVHPDGDQSTELAAYITYNGVSGYVKWGYLVQNKPTMPKTAKVTPTPTPAPTPVPTPDPADLEDDTFDDGSVVTYTAEDGLKITAVNCTLQYLNAKGKADGSAFTELDFTDGYLNPVTGEQHEAGSADIAVIGPNGKAPAYWIINGVRYEFNKIPAKIVINKLTYGITIEAVMKKGVPETLLSAAEIQSGRTGEALSLQTIDAKMCFVTAKGKGKGGWHTELDFTEAYTNLATEEHEEGGRITVQVKADNKGSRPVEYWLFNEAEFHFAPKVSYFMVREQNRSWTYQPIFGQKAKQTSKPTNKPTKKETDRVVEIVPAVTPFVVN